VGTEYQRLWQRFEDFRKIRNKVFHGQITSNGLDRSQLEKNIDDIRLWCCALASSATQEFGYDGFARNSFQKSSIPHLSTRLRVSIQSVKEYAEFIQKHMLRHQAGTR